MPSNTRREWIDERKAVLESAAGDELVPAALELASSDDPEALATLGTFLAQADFLDRLDDPASPDGKTAHLGAVLAPLRDRPGPEAARLALRLVDDPVYMENDRKSFLLEALARTTPMSAETAEAFQRANEQGYFGFNALLLAANGSPEALELFANMMADREVDVEARVELLHKGIVPHRNRLPILRMVASLMARDLEEPVRVAAVESVFDYQRQWFKIHGPMPPGWRTASDEALRFLVELGAQAKHRTDLAGVSQEAIDDTVEIARALLAGRAS